MADIPDNFLKKNPELTGTLKLGAAVRTIGANAFYNTKLEGLDLSQAAELVTIGNRAFISISTLKGKLVIPAKVETIEEYAFYLIKLTSLDLSNAASLVTIGTRAFYGTDITGTIVTPFTVPTLGGSAFPAGVTIVKG